MKFKFLGVFKRMFSWLGNKGKQPKNDRTLTVRMRGVISHAGDQPQLKRLCGGYADE